MKIDVSTTNYASMYAAHDQVAPSREARPDGTHLPDDAASAIVAISDSGKLAAQTAKNNPNAFLDDLLVEMLSGRKIQGVTAADLQAVRESGANSDLLLKRIERAALRAGFAIERRIPQESATVDQTTFQAKGVIRTAHGS